MRNIFWYTLFFLYLGVFEDVHAYEKHRIKHLPGWNGNLVSPMYTGYLKAGRLARFFYAFVESESDPANDPLILWFNGGPGCSSLRSFLMDHGPYRVTDDGRTLEKNPHPWTRFANVLYLETPAGTGFSYDSPLVLSSSDDRSTKQNLRALKDFLEKYPRFKSNDLYLSGFSYAAVYVSMLAASLVDEKDINFKGFTIGNGYIDHSKIANSVIEFARQNGILNKIEHKALRSVCCRDESDDSIKCELLGANYLCKQTAFGSVLMKAKLMGKNIWNLEEKKSLGSSGGGSCKNLKALETYLNRPDVQGAFRVRTMDKWQNCGTRVEVTYRRQYTTMRKFVQKALEAGKRGLIYAGDTDLACNYMGEHWFVQDLDRPPISQPYTWFHDGIEGGYVQYYDGIVFSTIHGTGHYPISDKPELVYKLITSFIQDKKLI
ncbi:lysosomal protective protein-like [Brevipalpus obovatus]|uniref:lysosomal protective protein-like n=1 Tax=Brevipalpus obovatus TaxID=246614 RepID=UPI003D9E732C